MKKKLYWLINTLLDFSIKILSHLMLKNPKLHVDGWDYRDYHKLKILLLIKQLELTNKKKWSHYKWNEWILSVQLCHVDEKEEYNIDQFCFINCPYATILLQSIYEDRRSIVQVVGFVDKIEEENVVQVVTDNVILYGLYTLAFKII